MQVKLKIGEITVQINRSLKKLILTIDSKSGLVVSKLFYKLKLLKNQQILNTNTTKMEIYGIKKFIEFAELCDKYNSDKGTNVPDNQRLQWPAHNYPELYERLFYWHRDQVLNVLECGIGTTNVSIPSNMTTKGTPGASLRVLRDFFPYANVIGVDIDKNVLFNEPGIETYQVDQTSADSIKSFIHLTSKIKFDLIIDDGLHTYEASITFFENIVERLANKGIYVIEDVRKFELIKYLRYFETKEFSVDIVVLHRDHIGIDDNNCIVIRKLDNN